MRAVYGVFFRQVLPEPHGGAHRTTAQESSIAGLLVVVHRPGPRSGPWRIPGSERGGEISPGSQVLRDQPGSNQGPGRSWRRDIAIKRSLVERLYKRTGSTGGLLLLAYIS